MMGINPAYGWARKLHTFSTGRRFYVNSRYLIEISDIDKYAQEYDLLKDEL